jgi:hypothetical protein
VLVQGRPFKDQQVFRRKTIVDFHPEGSVSMAGTNDANGLARFNEHDELVG